MTQAGYSSDGMQELYNNINAEIQNMIKQMKNAKLIVDKLNNNDYWSGNGVDYYEKKFNILASNFEAYCSDLYTLNGNIISSLDRYKLVDSKIQKIL